MNGGSCLRGLPVPPYTEREWQALLAKKRASNSAEPQTAPRGSLSCPRSGNEANTGVAPTPTSLVLSDRTLGKVDPCLTLLLGATKKGPCAGPFDGRYWARNGREADRLGLTWSDFEPLLQELLVDAEGRPISLSTTGFHSAFGRIRDKLADSEVVRELALAVLRELVGR